MLQDDDVMGLSGHMRAKCFLFNVLLKISKKDIIIKKRKSRIKSETMSSRRNTLGKISLRHELIIFLNKLSRLQKLHFPLKDYMDGSQSMDPTFKTIGWLQGRLSLFY